MTPREHHRLMVLFDEACELPPSLVRAYLINLSEADKSLRPALEAMLEVDHARRPLVTRVGALVRRAVRRLGRFR